MTEEEIELLKADNSSLRGSCKALGEENKNLKRKLKKLERLLAQNNGMQSGNQWISVDDRLPEPNIKVIVHSKRCPHFFAIRKNRQHAPWEFLDGDTCHEKITHWMPLPASPITNGDKQHE